MANILDYLDWRGDLSFASDSFNEVDNLILSNLSYLKLDGSVPHEINDSKITLLDLANKFMASKLPPSEYVNYYFPEKIAELLIRAAKTARFQNINLFGYVNRVDHQISNQFSAVIFSIACDEYFIAFRGTDNTIAGWKENLRMSFIDEVLAQKQAASYVNCIISNLKGRFYLGGHSKGGNLAVYAATHIKSEIRDKVLNIYNNDGPGFHKSIIESEGYQSVADKVNTIIPKSSVVGMLLEHGENFKVIDSSGYGILQHDAFLWEVKGPNFVYNGELSKNCRDFDNTIRLWLDNLSIEQREHFIDALFEIIQVTGAQTFNELSKEKLKVIDGMINKYRSMDSETQLLLKKTIVTLLNEGQKVYSKSIGEKIDLTFTKIHPRK
ncbi:DUF2974 domain-containing protein [Youngiibacter fragilis]|jgi:hypothetical protein|uniref:DUF2974 domain-containing protein n=1 Tax=Youngiibacter fragilis 232.1 TaxID=994573 RepID=V7I6L5_9CLOT|nr:DUF2974 domain-containing protein [Youngiibacter fragilis]ETA80617.1 hypothetical protein T472_0211190 [Youngiibacter fragilis 232.1]